MIHTWKSVLPLTRTRQRRCLNVVAYSSSSSSSSPSTQHSSRLASLGGTLAVLATGGALSTSYAPTDTTECYRQRILSFLKSFRRNVDGAQKENPKAPTRANTNDGETSDDTAAYFPTLDAHLVVHDETKPRLQPINLNTPVVLQNEYFQGTVYLNLLPLEPSHDPTFSPDTDPAFSIEVRGRVIANNKNEPNELENLYMGAQMALPMAMEPNLGSWGKQLCILLLRLLKAKIGGEMRYSFGTTQESPHISFPVMSSMQTSMTQHESSSQRHYTMNFQADSIDLASWKVCRPFELPLERLWGSGTPIQLIVYHQDAPHSPRTYLLQLQLTPKLQQEGFLLRNAVSDLDIA